ncbi:hypothetical protein N7U66_09085 [Lacinutrix neustonica]|uniref:Uncharacterized protein n=1 Tax=Lacinutrix neustonica TaxID=2980107 RepID=A0A9E8N0H0_9FLAO|nr:hypothetical protein [Lacinutrix neustonica]WAC03600.1 hypothetical protein N7U66_09085 [Lacinutrix neustonica]
MLTESEDEVKDLEKPRVTNKENKRLLAELIPGSVFNYELKNNEGETQYTLLFSR